jgi:hypothetical protein
MKALQRRLPGIRFETKLPPLPETLPRMDVAIFVGFAASGPLQTPVVVEESAQFTAIFGDEMPLAWDEQRGEMVTAYLASAVKEFFRNGGRRCWVVRVAGEGAALNYFPIPGLAHFDGTTITPAFAAARSRGSWADGLQVSASLTSSPLALVTTPIFDPTRLALLPGAPGDVSAGDLLRLTFRQAGLLLFCTVKRVEASAELLSPLALDATQRLVTVENALWAELPAPASLLSAPDEVMAFPHFGPNLDEAGIALAVGNGAITVEESEQGTTRVTVELLVDLADAPALGSLLRVEVEGRQLWLAVREVKSKTRFVSPLDASPLNSPLFASLLDVAVTSIEVSGEGFYWLPLPPVSMPAESPLCEKLTLELAVRSQDAYPQRLDGLAFAPSHPQYWGALPSDEQLYADENAEELALRAFPARADYDDLWLAATSPRFPLAGVGINTGFSLPVALPLLGDLYLTADRAAGDALVRAGLDDFDAALFLDRDMVGSGLNTLMEQADFIRYRSGSEEGGVGRALTGIHAALSIEEATIIAVPDAVHCGWYQKTTSEPPLPQPSKPIAHPQPCASCDCPPLSANAPFVEPPSGSFLDCALRRLNAPVLAVAPTISENGDFILSWTGVGDDVSYVLEESAYDDFTASQVIWRGATLDIQVSGRLRGDYFYRVRAVIGEEISSDWSNGVAVRVAPLYRWVVNESSACVAQGGLLLAVQRALLRMCAARGELLAVLALPAHYREDDALQHIALLRSFVPPRQEVAKQELAQSAGMWVAPLGYGESRAFSYGALYHPWLVERLSDQPLRYLRLPPDGAACGILAQRALNRGAWIAPANELLRDVVALTPVIDRRRWLDLQLAQINLVRQEARGFVVMNADTLSNDPDLRLINVRRLLMLLRRLALREGFRYVFEPNDDAFRRLVQRSFEGLLDQMFVRGAFAGTTAATSYQVVTSNTLNTRQSVEEGRLIVELRVAPSLPMSFLTIRLVQTHERTFVTE